jgi:hypothetical protein
VLAEGLVLLRHIRVLAPVPRKNIVVANTTTDSRCKFLSSNASCEPYFCCIKKETNQMSVPLLVASSS